MVLLMTTVTFVIFEPPGVFPWSEKNNNNNTTWNVTQEIGRRMTLVTEDTKKQHILFHAALLNGSPEGECGLLPKYFTH